MASPVLSRSPSANFAPGAHRRSHPNLQNLHSLSLAPLTPKYPIDPADYDAYFDPITSELHTSSSLSQIATLPSPGGILTHSPARSRNHSRVRRKAKSHVHLQLPEDATEARGDGDVVEQKALTSPSKSRIRLNRMKTDPSWLVQTGLSLTESSRETKGQSWIGKRDSSTSLANTPVDGYFDIRRQREGRTPRSGRATPARSRVASQNVSRNASRSRLQDLRMTGLDTAVTSFATAPDADIRIPEDEEDIEPNWADAKTQAEMAAHLQQELEDEWEEQDGDPYGMLDFDGQGDYDDEEEAEEEVRKAMRKWRVGGWLDGAVEALLMVEETSGQHAEPDLEGGEVKESEAQDDIPALAEDVPPGERSWIDAYWFARMLRRNAGL